jgi:hypothetical protein
MTAHENWEPAVTATAFDARTARVGVPGPAAVGPRSSARVGRAASTPSPRIRTATFLGDMGLWEERRYRRKFTNFAVVVVGSWSSDLGHRTSTRKY